MKCAAVQFLEQFKGKKQTIHKAMRMMKSINCANNSSWNWYESLNDIQIESPKKKWRETYKHTNILKLSKSYCAILHFADTLICLIAFALQITEYSIIASKISMGASHEMCYKVRNMRQIFFLSLIFVSFVFVQFISMRIFSRLKSLQYNLFIYNRVWLNEKV